MVLVNYMECREKKIYVVGHKNPDTDSICSAIAYAALKQKLSKEKYEAKRLGLLNAETKYVLERFGIDEPTFLSNVRLQIKDVDVNRMPGIRSNTSIKEAWEIMKEKKDSTIAITCDGKLEGVITTGDIATSYMDVYDNRIVSAANTQFKNIVNTVDGKVVTGDVDRYFSEGKVVVAASSPDDMEAFIEKNDIVILGNRYEAQLCAIELGVSCIIVSGNQITKTIKKLAEEKDVIVILTPYDTLTVGRLVNQSIPVEYFMKKEGLTIFNTADYVEDIKKDVAKDRTRDFPVVDKNGDFYGFMSSRRLMDATPKQLILVDHNEKTQAVDGVDEAEILEIIDHHRLGGLETIGPVFFRNQPVGCTATIIYNMYKENNIELDMKTAAILCAAIISDTLLFRSPTSTWIDRMVAENLASIACIDMEELAQNMFRAGSDLKGKTAEEICFQDFKQFTVGNVKFGVGQINSMDTGELHDIKKVLNPYLEQVSKLHSLDMVFFMLTNIIKEETEIIFYGKGAKEQVREAYDLPLDIEKIILKGVVSRKKQFIPTFVISLQK